MLLLFQVLALACVWVIFLRLWYSPASLLSPSHHIFDFSMSLCYTLGQLGQLCQDLQCHPTQCHRCLSDHINAQCVSYYSKKVWCWMTQVGGTSLYERLKLPNEDIHCLCGIWQHNAHISILSLRNRMKNKIINLICRNSTACLYSDSSKLIDQIHLVSLETNFTMKVWSYGNWDLAVFING